MPGIFILIISAVVLIVILRPLFSGKRKSKPYQSYNSTGKMMNKDEFQKQMVSMTSARASGKKDEPSWRKRQRNNYKSPFTDPFNPANPNSLLNPNNPANPNSPRHPMNPQNPASPTNPNNPANPNSRNHPLNPNNPNSPNYYGRKR